jgi:hypothetical protein
MLIKKGKKKRFFWKKFGNGDGKREKNACIRESGHQVVGIRASGYQDVEIRISEDQGNQ